MNKQMTFMSACRDYFGLMPGQSAMDFGKELKALTDKDREEIKAGLQANGYEIVVAAPVKVAG